VGVLAQYYHLHVLDLRVPSKLLQLVHLHTGCGDEPYTRHHVLPWKAPSPARIVDSYSVCSSRMWAGLSSFFTLKEQSRTAFLYLSMPFTHPQPSSFFTLKEQSRTAVLHSQHAVHTSPTHFIRYTKRTEPHCCLVSQFAVHTSLIQHHLQSCTLYTLFLVHVVSNENTLPE
jgi:hypothetical protein